MKKCHDYRPNVAAIILNRENQVFLGERVDSPGSWQIPQGGIKLKKNEKPKEALWRELEEELGLFQAKEHFQILAVHPNWLFYDFPDWVRKKGGKFAKYKGQCQKYYLLRFTGDEKFFTLEKDGEREFSAYKWALIDTIAENVASFKIEVTKKVIVWCKKNMYK